MATLTINFNKLYRPVFTTTARYIDVWGGRARGGSHFATDYFLYLVTQPRYFRGIFLRAVFSDIKDSLFKDFKDRVQTCVDKGELDLKDFAFDNNEYRITYKPTGNTIISKGFRKSSSTQSAKLKSIAGATHAIIEECEEVGEEDFTLFDDSLRTDKVAHIQVLRLFNPPGKNHWLMRRFYNLAPSGIKGWYRAEPKDLPELLSIHSTYTHNIRNVHPSTRKNYEAYGNPQSPLYKPDFYYRNVCGLVSDGKHGRIFTNTYPIKRATYDALPYPPFYGCDWGFNDPTAVMECKHYDGNLFVRQLIYAGGMDNDELMARMHHAGIDKKMRGYADSARPDIIRSLNRQGFHITAADKAPGSIEYGYRELLNLNIYITDDSPDMWLEAEEHCWLTDMSHTLTDRPQDAHNHGWDAIRYAYTRHIRKPTGIKWHTSTPRQDWDEWLEGEEARI